MHLVHNTGGAWSMFSGATAALGVFSIVMCAALAAFAVHERARISWPELIGLGLVIGGGIGNAIDRFALGYVVDFIDLSFMDFPVFNIADTRCDLRSCFVFDRTGSFANDIMRRCARWAR